MFRNLIIRHIILVSKEVLEDEDKSLFQGFSISVMNDLSGILSTISNFPYSILDFYLLGDKYVESKMLGLGAEVFLIREDLFESDIFLKKEYFNIIWSTELTFQASDLMAKSFEYEPIHISQAKNDHSINIQTLSFEVMYDLVCDRIRKVIEKTPSGDDSEFFSKLLTQCSKKELNYNHKFTSINHACVEPLLNVLNSYGYEIETKSIIPSETNSQNISAIRAAVNEIRKLRDMADNMGSMVGDRNDILTDALIYCPSIYAHLYNKKYIKNFFRDLNREEREMLKNVIFRNKNYSNFSINVPDDWNLEIGLKRIRGLISRRQEELQFFTLVIDIISVAFFLPAIRLPGSGLLHRDKLKKISSVVRNEVDRRCMIVKVNRIIKDYSNSIKEDFGSELVDLCFKESNKKLLLCVDFPLEWVSVDGMPIMFKHEVSKILTTPGSLFQQQILSSPKISLRQVDLFEILIIRSFEEDDPIRNHLMDAIEICTKNRSLNNLEINFANVKNQNDIEDALNKFKGNIVIFDCHGGDLSPKINAMTKMRFPISLLERRSRYEETIYGRTNHRRIKGV